jgi:plastocyanin
MRSTLRQILTGAGALSLLLGLVLPPAAEASHRTVTVSMQSFAYSPASVVVHVGDTVRWTYDETATSLPPGCETPVFQVPGSPVGCPGHSVTSTARRAGRPLFDSGVHRASGFPFRYRFTRPGTYAYYCTVHGGPHPNNPVTAMNGTVTVKP